MDGIGLLRSQQADFIKRLQTGHLLHCDLTGYHSELTVISGEKLRQLRDFCWDMAEKYKRTASVRTVFINNLKGKLGEEVIRARLGDRISEVDYERKVGGDGKIDFVLTANPKIGIQVKARYGTLDEVQWQFTLEEIKRNTVLVCVLLQEQVSEAQSQYNLVFAGFMGAELIETDAEISRFTIQDLLYSGGLPKYLEIFENRKQLFNSYRGIKQKTNADFNNLNCSKLWNKLLDEIYTEPFHFFFSEYCNLISFDTRSNIAIIEVASQSLMQLAQNKESIIIFAFQRVLNHSVKIKFQVKHGENSELQPAPNQFEVPIKIDDNKEWRIGDIVIHDVFGVGEITHIFGDPSYTNLGIKFYKFRMKIIDPKAEKAQLKRIKSNSLQTNI
ncbi:MAG: hypothetical protein SW833_02485 [Cyanobacteriota bacterium]|nr:hypothetical protein [Cyanobacteriota bacterium]